MPAAITRSSLLIAIVSTFACSPTSEDDHLPSDLRARVEEVKQEMSLAPTTAGTFAERTDVLWDWANAYALTGASLPIALTRHVARARLATALAEGPSDELLKLTDDYLRELQVKDEKPAALGSLRLVPDAPVESGSWIEIEQTFTVGEMPIQLGGGVLVGSQLGIDQGGLQTEDPAADNYFSIRVSREATRLEAFDFPPRRLGTATRVHAAYRVAGAALEQGDMITVTYGDRSGGSRGLLVQTWSTDRLLMPLYVDFEGEDNFFSLDWPVLRVVGSALDSVVAFAPSTVGVGEPFDLLVRSQDRYLNRAVGALPGYEVLLGNEVVHTIPAGEEPAVVVEGLSIDEPGAHRFTVRSEDGTLRTTTNPIWVERDPDPRIYFGETHVHSGYAEGQGSAEEVFRYATEDARLDFLGYSEHDNYLDDYEWRRMQELSRQYNEEGRFVTFLAYEWTVPAAQGGHNNVLFRTPDRDRVGRQVAATLPDLYRGLRRGNDPEDVLIIPHAHEPGDWTRNDPEMEKLVEIYSMHGSFEWFGNLFLQNGFEVGFVAASDDHRAKPGYSAARSGRLRQFPGLAAVIAPAKTRDALFDAMRGLSAYATSGERILLDARLNGRRMGSRLAVDEVSDERHLVCRVSGTAAIDRIEVIRNGEVVFGRSYLPAPLTSHSWILVGFESSSEPASEAYPSRGRSHRRWKGTLTVKGAHFLGVSAPGFENPHLESAAIVDAEGGAQIDFETWTRGRIDTMLIELEGATSSTSFDFQIDPAGGGGTRAAGGRGAEAPSDFLLDFAAIEAGRLEHTIESGRYTDRVSLQVVRPDASLDQVLELRDLDPPSAGDYYYVRVTQIDGGRAWSSPWFIGEADG